jgi:hypothetical protein
MPVRPECGPRTRTRRGSCSRLLQVGAPEAAEARVDIVAFAAEEAADVIVAADEAGIGAAAHRAVAGAIPDGYSRVTLGADFAEQEEC